MKYNKQQGAPDTSQPLADIFSCLMLMFMLILMLVILFVGYKDEARDTSGPDGGYGAELHDDDGGGDNDDGGGGGEGDRGESTAETEDLMEPDLPGGDGLAAVKIVVIDADTGEVIESDGIKFNLLSGYQGDMITLHSYYPEKISYDVFETMGGGSFFLPEKVGVNTYVIKNIAAPVGYISGGSVSFTVAEATDWETPQVVYFPLSMKKYSFAIRVTDKESGKAIPMGVYDIYTTEGNLVGTITCDVGGFGRSELLSPNNRYVVEQRGHSEFYAALDEPIIVTLDGTPDKIVDIRLVKSTAEFYMVDELEKTPIEGVVLAVYGPGGEKYGEFTTNSRGLVRLQNLYKSMTYTVRQVGWADKWQQSAYEAEFTVDADGKISGRSVYAVTGTNRMIRVSFALKDSLFGTSIEGEEMTLLAGDGQIVRQWDSEKPDTLVEGLAPGRYTLEGSGKSMELLIEDSAEIQNFNLKITEPTIIILGVLGIVSCLAAVVALIVLIANARKKKKH